MDETTFRICPWCSTEIYAGAGACPNCGALVEGALVPEIPGLTDVDPNATLESDGGRISRDPDPNAWLEPGHDDAPADDPPAADHDAPDHDAVQPPSEEVRLEMRKMELEAQIENAGSTVMNPTDDAPADDTPAADHDAPDHDAVQPPSEEVRVEIRKMELEAEIENAGSTVMNPTGDESIEVGAPSDEALEALEAGLLNLTVPAAETDMAELGAPWEDPELERRVSMWHDEEVDET